MVNENLDKIPELLSNAPVEFHGHVHGTLLASGRITAICDCYDSVKTKKPFKDPITSFEAMALLTKEADNYDPALIRNFIGMMRGAGQS